jgi:hypothetical protein
MRMPKPIWPDAEVSQRVIPAGSATFPSFRSGHNIRSWAALFDCLVAGFGKTDVSAFRRRVDA